MCTAAKEQKKRRQATMSLLRNCESSRTTKSGFSRANSVGLSSRMVSAPGCACCTCWARDCNSVSPRVFRTSWMETRIWLSSPTCDNEPVPLRIYPNILPATYWRSAGEAIHWRKGRSCSRLCRVERFRRELSDTPMRAIFAAAVRLIAATYQGRGQQQENALHRPATRSLSRSEDCVPDPPMCCELPPFVPLIYL